jgi:hypothetical protein
VRPDIALASPEKSSKGLVFLAGTIALAMGGVGIAAGRRNSPGSRFRAAMVLAIVADALQLVVFPFFVEGALSPADDILDFGIAAVLVYLCQARTRSRFGSFLDDGDCKRLSEIEAGRGHGRRKS